MDVPSQQGKLTHIHVGKGKMVAVTQAIAIWFWIAMCFDSTNQVGFQFYFPPLRVIFGELHCEVMFKGASDFLGMGASMGFTSNCLSLGGVLKSYLHVFLQKHVLNSLDVSKQTVQVCHRNNIPLGVTPPTQTP